MQELHVKSLLPVRLDKYLMEQFPALGLGRLNKALRENKIKLNGQKAAPCHPCAERRCDPRLPAGRPAWTDLPGGAGVFAGTRPGGIYL